MSPERIHRTAPQAPEAEAPVQVIPPRRGGHISVALGAHASNFKFPENFLWGAATSAHQVEGLCTGNDWWAWEQAGRVPEKSGEACDHYHRFAEDFDLARSLHHNAHRLSLEWSRIEPEEGRFSVEAIEHYREVLCALRERGMEPIVTLNHYTLPLWVAGKGGWEYAGIERLFERFVSRVVEEYRGLVTWWITLNEPMVLVFKGYILGQWPPGKQDYRTAFRVIRHLLRAHVRAYHAIHDRQPAARVSVAQHVLALTPCDPRSLRDQLSVHVRMYLFNQLFVDGLVKGVMRVPGMLWERLPSGRTLDFIGLNYYTRDFVKSTGLDFPGLVGNVCTVDNRQRVSKRNSLGWEVYPEGLARFLREFSRYRLPILITENGAPAVRDEDRWLFIFMHLWQVARAISDGMPVVGYLYWSLLDNFEWADGFTPRFGLIKVDYRTQRRTVRDSARKMAYVISRNEL